MPAVDFLNIEIFLIETITKQTKSIYFQLRFSAGSNTHTRFNIIRYKDYYYDI